METQSIKKINLAGKIGYIISILLIVCTIVAMVGVGICTGAAFAVAKNEINVTLDTNVTITSTGNFLNNLSSFVKIDGVEDLTTLTEDAKDGLTINDKDISELTVKEEDGGLNVKLKTNEISISMKKIIVCLIATFIYLLAITVALYKVKALMKSLKEAETPFAPEVINKMTIFANTLVVVIILKTVFDAIMSSISSGLNIRLSIDLGSILLVAVIYLLIIVFKYGAKLQQESDETI